MKRICLAACLLLAGCTGNLLAPSGAPAKLYTLATPATVSTTAPQASWQLLVDTPDAILDLNSSRIAVAPSPDRIDYFADVAWVDRPPAMIQELLLQCFDKSGRIAAVQRQGGGLRGDFALASDLQDFQVESGPGEAAVHVRLTARLIRTRDRSVVASRVFEARVPVSGGFGSAVAGFDDALQSLLPQIVDWTLVQGAAIREVGLSVPALAVALLRAGIAAAAPAPIVIATGPASGFALPLGAEICHLYEQAAKDKAACFVAATAGSVDDLARLRAGEVALAIVQSDVALDAIGAGGAFSGQPPFAGLRSIAGFYAETLTVLVRSDGPIKQADDLKGKRVTVGEPGFPDPLFNDFLDALGWSKADLSGVAEMPRADQVASLCDGKVAALAVTAPHPNGFVRGALAACPLTVLDLAGPGIDAVTAAHPAYAPAQVDLAQYGRPARTIRTFGPRAILVTTAKLDDEIVTRLMTGIFAHGDELRRAHPALGGLDSHAIDTGSGLGIERHPAAAKYLAENKLGEQPSGE